MASPRARRAVTTPVTRSQRTAAKVVGFTYLAALVPAVFAEFYVPTRFYVANNAVETAHRIMTHERLFRLGIASNLIVFSAAVALIAALYVVLEPVGRGLALYAAFFRLVETAVLFATTFSDFTVLRLLSGAEYLRAIDPDRLAALARVAFLVHGDIYSAGLFLCGVGYPVFNYLWLKSGYIPKPLAAFGLFATLWLGAWMFALIVFPELRRPVAILIYGPPIFLFEVTIGIWLLARGLRTAEAASP